MSRPRLTPVGRLRRKWQRFRHERFDDFFFVHINKTGGSSVEHALGLPFEHVTARGYIERHGRAEWDRRFTFTVVRNPWDKVVSHFHHRVKTNQTGLGERAVPFAEWVRRAYGEKDPALYDKPLMFQPQLDWIAGDGGEVLVRKVCRFESLEADFQDVCRSLGRSATLPHLKKSDRGDFRSYYDDATAEIVGRWFAPDLRAFGYAW